MKKSYKITNHFSKLRHKNSFKNISGYVKALSSWQVWFSIRILKNSLMRSIYSLEKNLK